MSLKKNQPWLPMEKIESFVQLEPALFIIGLAIVAWLISKIFLRQLPEERKRTLNGFIKNLGFHLGLGSLLFSSYYALQQIPYEGAFIDRLLMYAGLGTILAGATVFIKTWRILVFEYFFLRHRKVAFPVLLVNLFILLLSLLLGSWICTELFSIQIAPLLATSAIFSLVLGLALQDTLGNLFAGVALQFDKPYGIGDWVEIQSSGQKWVGQVCEISWRATGLISFTEEIITVPNRLMGQSQIFNYSTKHRPVIRSLVFHLPLSSKIDQIKAILLDVSTKMPGIRKVPAPLVLISETTESWVGFKLVYYLDDFGQHYIIADQAYSLALEKFQEAGIELAGHRLIIPQQDS